MRNSVGAKRRGLKSEATTELGFEVWIRVCQPIVPEENEDVPGGTVGKAWREAWQSPGVGGGEVLEVQRRRAQRPAQGFHVMLREGPYLLDQRGFFRPAEPPTLKKFTDFT